MKKYLMVLCLIISSLSAFGQYSAVTGTITDAGGNVATSGTVVFRLSGSSGVQYYFSGTNVVTPTTTTCNISGTGTISCNVGRNDLLVPAGTTYCIDYYPNGVKTNTVCKHYIATASYSLQSPVFLTQQPSPQFSATQYYPITGSIIPNGDNIFTLGDANHYYSNAYINNLPKAIVKDPWYDIRFFGAKCNGTTDDTSSIQTALNTANTVGGGKVLVPTNTTGSCIIASNLSMASFKLTSLECSGTQNYPTGTPRCWLQFSGNNTYSPLISMTSTYSSGLVGLYLQATNAAFTGTMVELTHDGSGNDTTKAFLKRNVFAGTNGQHNVGILINADDTIDSVFEDNFFKEYIVGINGANSNTHYTVNNRFVGNHFSDAVGTCANGGSHLQNLTDANVIIDNTFEQGSGSGGVCSVISYTATNIPCKGNSFIGNWIGDVDATKTYNIFNMTPSCGAVNINGNIISGTATSTIFTIGNNTDGINISANRITNASVVYAFGTNVNSVQIDSNQYGTITTCMTGTPSDGQGNFSAGCTGRANNHIFWGGSSFIGNVIVSGTSLFQLGSTTVGSLTTCNSGATGILINVTDSTAIVSEGQACVGGSTNKALAYCNGTAWKCF